MAPSKPPQGCVGARHGAEKPGFSAAILSLWHRGNCFQRTGAPGNFAEPLEIDRFDEHRKAPAPEWPRVIRRHHSPTDAWGSRGTVSIATGGQESRSIVAGAAETQRVTAGLVPVPSLRMAWRHQAEIAVTGSAKLCLTLGQRLWPRIQPNGPKTVENTRCTGALPHLVFPYPP